MLALIVIFRCNLIALQSVLRCAKSSYQDRIIMGVARATIGPLGQTILLPIRASSLYRFPVVKSARSDYTKGKSCSSILVVRGS